MRRKQVKDIVFDETKRSPLEPIVQNEGKGN